MSVASVAAGDILAVCDPEILGEPVDVDGVVVNAVFAHLRDDLPAGPADGLRLIRARLTTSATALGYAPVTGARLRINATPWEVARTDQREDLLRITLERYGS